MGEVFRFILKGKFEHNLVKYISKNESKISHFTPFPRHNNPFPERVHLRFVWLVNQLELNSFSLSFNLEMFPLSHPPDPSCVSKKPELNKVYFQKLPYSRMEPRN